MRTTLMGTVKDLGKMHRRLSLQSLHAQEERTHGLLAPGLARRTTLQLVVEHPMQHPRVPDSSPEIRIPQFGIAVLFTLAALCNGLCAPQHGGK